MPFIFSTRDPGPWARGRTSTIPTAVYVNVAAVSDGRVLRRTPEARSPHRRRCWMGLMFREKKSQRGDFWMPPRLLTVAEDSECRAVVKTSVFLVIIFYVILAHSGCRPVPDAFSISIASGGGFTGLVGGFYLHSNGKVEAWRRFPAQPDSILWTVQVDPRKIAEFAQQLEQTGVVEKTYKATGNMTTRVIYSLQDVSHTWSWSNEGDAPPELKEWYGRVRKFCGELSEKQQRQREEPL